MRIRLIVVLISFIFLGGAIVTPTFASSENSNLDIIERISLYRSENNFVLTSLANIIITLSDRSPYLLPSKLVQSTEPEIIQLAKNITEDLEDEHDKSKAIFTWIASHVKYDTETYFKDPLNPRYYTSLETLQTKVALCSGYANLNAALHRAIGIKAKIVYGEGHAWNEVYIKGKWQLQDPTYGAGSLDTEKKIFLPKYTEKYFTSVDLMWEGDFPW